MAKLSSIRIDQTKANEGTWAKYSGFEFLIARYNSNAADTLRNTLALENLELLQSGTPEGEEKGKEIDLKVLAQAILLDWKGIEDDNDQEIPFSKEKALEVLSDPGFAELKQFIQNHSVNRASYVAHVEEQVTEQVKPTADS